MGTTWQLPDQTDPDPILSRSHSGFRPYLLAVPFGVLLLSYLFVAAHSARERLASPWTMSGWESAIVVDAWRIVHKQPVYTDPKVGHATHMYGPLATYVVAPFIKSFGPDGRIPRYIAMIATLLLCVSASILLSHRANYRWLTAFVLFSLFYLQFYRIREWATESRPDATSILIVFIALCACYRAIKSESLHAELIWMLAGTSAVVVAFLFKQTSAWMVIVPPLAVLVTRPRFAVHKMLFAFLPFAAVVITVLILKSAFPWVYFYMVEVPRQYPVSIGEWLSSVLESLRYNLLFIACCVCWICFHITARHGHRDDTLEIWLLLTSLCAFVIGAAGRAKFGGFFNSMLPAYLAMAGLSGGVLTRCFRLSAEQFHSAWLQIFVASAPIVLFLGDISATGRTFNPGSLALSHGDTSFHRIIAIAENLPGKFVSPDDPIIALRAKGFAGRNSECEMDAAGRDRSSGFRVPGYFLAEIKSADWVLQVNASRESAIPARDLIRLGFEKTTGIVPSPSVYLLWKRKSLSYMGTTVERQTEYGILKQFSFSVQSLR